MPQVDSKATLLIQTSLSLMRKKTQTYKPTSKNLKNSSDILLLSKSFYTTPNLPTSLHHTFWLLPISPPLSHL